MAETPASPPKAPEALPAWLAATRRGFWRRGSTWLGLLVLLLLAGGAWWWQASRARQAAPQYLTEAVSRGDIAVVVSANGTLQPTRSVSIGSELSGTVAEVLVDVNDRVKRGQVLVRLDAAKLADQVAKSQGVLEAAQASLQQAKAANREASLTLARLYEVQRRSGGQVPAASEIDAAQSSVDQARANEAAAVAAVRQAEAGLRTDQTNLAKASIRSPIDGVILSRAVEPGNAVAASLQAVTLFTLAEDLTRMKLSVDVDEADVGQVQAGQKASFSVSAWPSRQYPAEVARVAYGSTKTDNVVTYTTDLVVHNEDLSLRPGMTATASIRATERRAVLRVPNAALSFQPAQGGAPAAGGGGGGATSILSKLMPRPPGMGGRSKTATLAAGGSRQVWVLANGVPQPVVVQAGLSNGQLTEVSGPDLKEGMAVITQMRSSAARP